MSFVEQTINQIEEEEKFNKLIDEASAGDFGDKVYPLWKGRDNNVKQC